MPTVLSGQDHRTSQYKSYRTSPQGVRQPSEGRAGDAAPATDTGLQAVPYDDWPVRQPNASDTSDLSSDCRMLLWPG